MTSKQPISVFDKIHGYGFVHHRALNNFDNFYHAMQLIDKHPARSHIMEGDICWHEQGGQIQFYFRHPNWIIDTLSGEDIESRLEQKSLVGLDDLLNLKDRPCFLIIELKVGRGDWRAAMTSLISFLEENFHGRYWIDGFSLSMLEFIKKNFPLVPVSLHTEFVFNGYVVVGAPEFPPIRIRKLAHLDFIDGIAIRWRFGQGFMAKACQDVHDAGKVLIISRLHDLQQFESSKKWNAVAGYMHWDFESLLEVNDQIDARNDVVQSPYHSAS